MGRWGGIPKKIQGGFVAFSLAVFSAFYTMPYKIQPIRMQESRCVFIRIPPNRPIVYRIDCDYFNHVIFHDVVKIVMQSFPVVYHGISHLSFVFSLHIQVTSDIFHGIPLEINA